MKYLDIKDVKKGKCSICSNKASKKVDEIPYCSTCTDTLLMMNIKRCISNLTHVGVKITIVPVSKIYEREKKESLKKDRR